MRIILCFLVTIGFSLAPRAQSINSKGTLLLAQAGFGGGDTQWSEDGVLSYNIGADVLLWSTGSVGVFSLGGLLGYQSGRVQNNQFTINNYIFDFRCLYHFTKLGNDRTSIYGGLQWEFMARSNTTLSNTWRFDIQGGPMLGARHLFGPSRRWGLHAELAHNVHSAFFAGATFRL